MRTMLYHVISESLIKINYLSYFEAYMLKCVCVCARMCCIYIMQYIYTYIFILMISQETKNY